jgi:hypothetical protein
MQLQAAYRGLFATNTEFDLSNNSGSNSTIGGLNRYNIYVQNSGSTTSTSLLEIGSGNTTVFSSIWGLHLSGTSLASNSVIAIDASSAVGIGIGTRAGGAANPMFSDSVIKDGGAISRYGLYLNGTYANQAIFAGGVTSNTNGAGADQGQIIVSPTSGANRLQLGYVFQAGIKEYGRIQASNSDGATPLMVQQAGGVVFFGPAGIALHPLTVSGLPTCNAANAGVVTYVTDATSPNYNGTLIGGGSVKTLALCNGSAWTAH